MGASIVGADSGSESLELPRTGPAGWKIYTARVSKFLLMGTQIRGSYFDLRWKPTAEKNLFGQERLLGSNAARPTALKSQSGQRDQPFWRCGFCRAEIVT